MGGRMRHGPGLLVLCGRRRRRRAVRAALWAAGARRGLAARTGWRRRALEVLHLIAHPARRRLRRRCVVAHVIYTNQSQPVMSQQQLII